MPHAENGGVRIHYRVEGSGAPLVLQHGFSDCLETWYDLRYVEGLKSARQLILIDARGHGASDKPHETAAYAWRLQAADVVAVMQALSIARADFFGYSMGGQIGFAMARHAPERLRGLIIGGAAGAGLARAGDRLLAALEAGGVEALPGIWGVPLPPALHARLLTNDIAALKASRADNPGFADGFRTMLMPCVVFAGTADPICGAAEAAAAQIPNASFFSLPGLGHVDTLLRTELVLPRVTAFLGQLDHAGVGGR